MIEVRIVVSITLLDGSKKRDTSRSENNEMKGKKITRVDKWEDLSMVD